VGRACESSDEESEENRQQHYASFQEPTTACKAVSESLGNISTAWRGSVVLFELEAKKCP
jgi:hypothetical protein